MMVADVEAGTSFDSGTPRVLFPASPQWATGNLNGVYFAVHPDDERFLVATRSVGGAESQREGPPPPVILVNNFFEELKARVPE
jgi:hypothetical protein